MRSRLAASFTAGLLLALVFFLIELPLLYRDGPVEADGVRMSYGIANAIRSGEGLASRDMYGRTFSFGYYALFLGIYPHVWGSFTPLVTCMNAFNLVCVSAAFIPLVLWMSALWGRRVGLAAGALLATTPILFELGATGHPEGPAFLALNAALALFLESARPEARKRAILRFLATAAAFAALTLRADVLFAFPLFVLLAPLAKGPGSARRALATGAAVALLAVAGFFAAQAMVVARIPAGAGAAAGSTQPNILRIFLDYWAGAKEAGNLLKGAAIWAVSLGPLLFGAGLLGTVAAFRRRERTFAWAAMAILIPAALFWLPDPSPARHFLMTFLVLVPAAVLWLRERVGPTRFAMSVVLLLVFNVASMAAAYPLVVRHYAFPLKTLLARRVSTSVPMGDPITNRIWTRRQVALEVALARELAASDEPRLFVVGTIVTNRLLYEIYAKSPAYRVEYVRRSGAFLCHAVTPRTEYWIYQYAPGQLTPRELLERIAGAGEFRDFAIAIIPSDNPVTGAGEVPRGYRAFTFTLDELAGLRP